MKIKKGLKVKVKFTLQWAMKAQRGELKYNSTLSLTRALGGGGQRYAAAALPPGKRPVTHCTGGWVGPRVGLVRDPILIFHVKN
jgi:hypothetical protein